VTFKITPLPHRQIHALRASFARLRQTAASADFLTVEEIQSAYDTQLASGNLDEQSLAALGAALGEMICAHGDFEWVHLSDEYGSGPALASVGFDAVCNPIGMIEKRLARGEAADLVELCADTVATIQKMIEAGEAGPRSS
jgi:hypothetical protein